VESGHNVGSEQVLQDDSTVDTTSFDCSSCDDVPDLHMKNNGLECSTYQDLAYYCKTDYWMENKYCQFSCWNASLGYDVESGHNVGSEQILQDDSTVLAEPVKSSELENVNTSFGCNICDDVPDVHMKSNGLECSTYQDLAYYCTTDTWKRKKYCQSSCWNANVGYDGDNCCDEA